MSSAYLSALDDFARTALTGEADAYFRKLLLSTIVLLIGVVLEEFDPFNRLRDVVFNLRRGVPESSKSVAGLKKGYAKAAIFMVVAGIVGEGIYEYLGARAEGSLRDFENTLVAESRRESAEAQRETADTALRAATVEREAELLRARILATFGPRVLSDEQIDRISEKLRPLAGKVSVDVLAFEFKYPWNESESMDSRRLAGYIASALTRAHVDVAEWLTGMCGVYVQPANVVVNIPKESPPLDSVLAFSVLNALKPEVETFPELEHWSVKQLNCKVNEALDPSNPNIRPQNAGIIIAVGKRIPGVLTPKMLDLRMPPSR